MRLLGLLSLGILLWENVLYGDRLVMFPSIKIPLLAIICAAHAMLASANLIHASLILLLTLIRAPRALLVANSTVQAHLGLGHLQAGALLLAPALLRLCRLSFRLGLITVTMAIVATAAARLAMISAIVALVPL
jgi:hypothetical protein